LEESVDLDRLWQAVLGDIEISMSQGNFITWFKRTALLEASDTGVVIGVPNVFFKTQLENKYSATLAEALKRNHLPSDNISYRTHSFASTVKKEEEMVPETTKQQTLISATPRQSSNGLTQTYRRGINADYTFDSFVVGSGNEIAYAACQAVAVQPGEKYNPLFLYGGVGIGKTHLIQAVGNAVLAENPRARVVYVTSEQFLQEFVDSIRFKKISDFAGFYRNADVLIVDDIQFIAGKDKVQEEFFHTFNALRQAKKQIILSSDKPPKDIAALEERLRSRFVGGVTIDMQTPDFETRCAIIKAKAESRSFNLDNEVVEYLANYIQTNIRELEGGLNKILAVCEMRSVEPTLPLATSILGALNTRPKHLSAKQIIETCAKHFQIPVADVLSPRRDKDIVAPRQFAMYLLRSELKLSFPKIAQELGRKDHTTAIHSINKIEQELHIDPELRETITALKDQLYA
jgi:chromosomal replication initiator protein